MNLIEKEIQKIDHIISIYKEEVERYEIEAKDIIKKIKIYFEPLAENHGLITKNSVKDIKYYSFVYRVKEPDSLREKFIRNNLLYKHFSFIQDDFAHQQGLKPLIVEGLRKIDDLIGIRILTDINNDCKKVYDLIREEEFKNKLADEVIVIDEGDLIEQPVPMKNGLEIYKMTGTKAEYKFELQIKSKILSAWGDMEHTIFYKNYSISPVRENTKASMQHIGRLLFQIDDFLESIRIANKKYEQSANVQEFLQWFDNNYSELLKNNFNNIGLKIDQITELLYAIYNDLGVKEKALNNNLRFNHFEFSGTNESIVKYIEKRKLNNDLKILEAITLSWLMDDNVEITQEALEEKLTEFISAVKRAIVKAILKINDGYDEDTIKNIIERYYNYCLKYNCEINSICKISYLAKYIKKYFGLKDLIEEDIGNRLFDPLLDIVFVKVYKGDYENIVVDKCAELGINKADMKEKLLIVKENIKAENDTISQDLAGSINFLINKL